MRKETIYRILVSFFSLLFITIVILLKDILNNTTILFLTVISALFVLVALELYLRIQHNIEIKFTNLFEKVILANDKLKTLDDSLKILNEKSNSHQIRNLKETNLIIPKGTISKINLKKYPPVTFPVHRSGWKYAIDSLIPLHNPQGAIVDGCIDKKFLWGEDPGDLKNNPISYTEPWIGFFHSAVNYAPNRRINRNPELIFKSKLWKESEKYCKGIFCLSEYQKEWLKKITNVPIESLIHPTETPKLKFNIPSFKSNPNRGIIQIGTTLRKISSIYFLPKIKIKRFILHSNPKFANELLREEQELFRKKIDPSKVITINHISNQEYDKLLSNNLVFIDLWDVAACNTLIECIVRNTPILINPHPAAIEYLGKDYPFYFNSLEEAAKKADNMKLIKKTHQYLVKLAIKKRLTRQYFLKSFVNSEIYKKL